MNYNSGSWFVAAMQRTNAQRSEQPTCSPAEPSSLISIQSFRRLVPFMLTIRSVITIKEKFCRTQVPPFFKIGAQNMFTWGPDLNIPKWFLADIFLHRLQKCFFLLFGNDLCLYWEDSGLCEGKLEGRELWTKAGFGVLGGSLLSVPKRSCKPQVPKSVGHDNK